MQPTLLNNRYRLIRELGSGGFGKTFLVEDTQLPSGRRCVIKQLKPVTNNPQTYQLIQERFQREAAILEELGEESTQIPKLYAYFSEKGQFYLVQEWIEGQTLADKMQTEGPLSESSVKEILKGLLPVLDYVHSKRLVHRDIKPDNIILRQRDGKPVLIDFGAVRETMGTVMNSHGNPTSSIVIGTPGFMSSEQAVGRPIYSSDLYSLGLTAIYLLTGKVPQELETEPHTGEILWHRYALSVSPSFVAVLSKAIQSHVRDRYSSAREMLEALQSSYASIPPTQPSPHYTPKTPPTVLSPQHSPGATSGGAYSVPPTELFNQSGMVGGGGTFNNAIPVPPGISGWNWGAFMLPGFWPFSNQVWIGLICWIPYVGFVMTFILGAKGNVWAWRSRQWRSVEAFKAHQRAWVKAGLITYASLIGLTMLLVVIGIVVGPKRKPSTNYSSNKPAQSNDSTKNPTGTLDNTPPKITLNGVSEQLTEPNSYINGLWRLQFSVGTTRYDSGLYMKGPLGIMRTRYFNPRTKTTENVDQTMRLWSSSQGLILKGYNPVYANTPRPDLNYNTDQFLFQQRSDGTFQAVNCDNAGVCSQTRVEFVRPNP